MSLLQHNGTKTVKKSVVHHGKLLKSLAEWWGGYVRDFPKQFGKSYQWYNLAVKDERISNKNINAICRAFNIPVAYFEGTYELPLKNTVAEPDVSYNKHVVDLKKENDLLKEQLLQLQTKYITVQEMMLEMQKELNALSKRT